MLPRCRPYRLFPRRAAASLVLGAVIAFFVGIPRAHGAPSLSSVDSFAYQLQNIDLTALAESPYDLIIIDYSRDGTGRSAFRPSEIAALKAAGKTVLAYLSIGEAEDYRFYFKSRWVRSKAGVACRKKISPTAPSWLEAANPDWCGNYKVRFWEPAWQRILYGVRAGGRKSYLDRIIDAGFDGVYLDIIDAYDYWNRKPQPARRLTAARDMARLVIGLGRYARQKRNRPNFIVVPQNGAAIIRRLPPRLRGTYLKSIQGVGAEDIFYFGTAAEDNPLAPQPVIALLEEYLRAGKKVFATDYLLDPAKGQDFLRRACERGFIPQTSNRALDTLAYHSNTGCSCVLSVGPRVC